MYTSFVFVALAVVVVFVIARTATVVPQQSAYVIESLGKYSRTLQAGFHVLIPFVERVAYRHNLKEQALDVAEQICITRDNVQVGVDAVLYMQVLDPHLRMGLPITASQSHNSRRRRYVARSARSSSTARSKPVARSTPTWSPSSTKPPWPGA